MGFTIQDVAKFLINPLIPVFVILLIQLVREKKSKRLLIVLFLYTYLVTIPATSKVINSLWVVEDTFDYSETYDAVVVLSGISISSLSLSIEPPITQFEFYYLFNQSADRVIMGAKLVQAGHARQFLIGDPRFRGSSEAQFVKTFLELQGIPSEKIFVYGEVENTLEEAEKVKQYIDQHDIKKNKLALVTSASHMRRAVALFNKQGLYPAHLSVLRPNTNIGWPDFIPSESGLRGIKRMAYEIVGYVGYWMLSVFLN